MNCSVGLIGFGEAGSTFAKAARWGDRASAYDVLPERREAMAEAGIRPCDDASEALREADIALSLVTADQALEAASSGAAFLKSGTLWCDMNSVAPDTKRKAAIAIETAGGAYLDVAVLAPVHPAMLAVPLLVSGRAADAGVETLRDLGFCNVRNVGMEVGRASSIKMIRSVMVKGIEALTAEMMAAADAAGVVDDVLASLDASDGSEPWRQRAAYNLERMATHGGRRAAEMKEVAATLRALGIEPVMSESTVIRQRAAAEPFPKAQDAA